MKKQLLSMVFCLLTVVTVRAELKVSTENDGTVVFTLEASGDIEREFTEESWAKYRASDKVKPYLSAEKIKIITANGVKMSSNDLKRISGMAEEENNFPNLQTLSLEYAEIQNDNDLTSLKFMDRLKTVTFPRTTTAIPQMCLNHGSCKIENVIIPDNPARSVNVGTQAFGATLKTIRLGEVKADENSSVTGQAFLGCVNLISADFGFGWKEIGQQAFMDCTALKEITLPEGLETIGYGAFSGSAIEAIRLPNTLKRIEATAFRCHYLKSITIPASVEEIKTQAFQECYALTDVYVLGTKTKVGNQAFQPDDVSLFMYENPTHISPARRDMYKRTNGKGMLTMLHYPEAAKNDYVNPYSRSEGGSTKSVAAEGGNIWPTFEDGKYSNAQGDYAGWNNFALSTPLKQDEIWEDDKRVDDKWYTLCLPFDMTEMQLKSAYGADVEVVEFSGVEIKELGNKDKSVTLKFKNPVKETKAHHPYMIHPAINARSTTGVKNTIVGIKKEAEKQESLDAQKVVFSAGGVTYTFIGNYTSGKELQQYSYYYYSGKDESRYKNGFYKWPANGGGTWNVYTACVLLDKDNGANAKPAILFYEMPGYTTTAISAINVSTERGVMKGQQTPDKVMNLNGQVVRTGSTSLQGLPKGVYVVNGKKYIVR